jgi:hypothetical protein
MSNAGAKPGRYNRRMARGFDSKFVEAQQEEATRPKTIGPGLTPEQRVALDRRKALELSRARAAGDLERATVPAHRKMLEQAIAALDAELEKLRA